MAFFEGGVQPKIMKPQQQTKRSKVRPAWVGGRCCAPHPASVTNLLQERRIFRIWSATQNASHSNLVLLQESSMRNFSRNKFQKTFHLQQEGTGSYWLQTVACNMSLWLCFYITGKSGKQRRAGNEKWRRWNGRRDFARLGETCAVLAQRFPANQRTQFQHARGRAGLPQQKLWQRSRDPGGWPWAESRRETHTWRWC